jgi:putative FmdB family regulatory protein
MPTFDYRCTDCDTTYEVFHKVHEKSEDIVCPKCGSPYHRKQMSAPAVSMTGFAGSNSSSGSFGGGPARLSHGGCAGGSCGLN